MLQGVKVAVIQNTNYHFETALSVYSALEDMGAEVCIRRCVPDKFGQVGFMSDLGMRQVDESDLGSFDCGVVVSAYPNPQVQRPNSIPMQRSPSIRMFGDRLVYVSHRFGCREDYESEASPVRAENSVCLSPLSARIGVDHICLIDMPIRPFSAPLTRPIELTIQGHFWLNNRRMPDWLLSVEDGSNRARLKLLGTKAYDAAGHKRRSSNFVHFTDQPEPMFYYVLNRRTHFLLPMIDDEIKGGTYVRERFSSNFNQAFALEKPVFCHEVFRDIYGVPGVYYNYSNCSEMVESLFRMTPDEYASMVGEFGPAKAARREHNRRVLLSKVSWACGR